MTRLSRSWRAGNFRAPLPPPVRPLAVSEESLERLVRPGERFLTRRQLAVIYPDAGKGWDARSLAEGRRSS
jgi:hypothetical protein